MPHLFYGMAVASVGFAVIVTLPYIAWSYAAYQRMPQVGDGLPYCATCHSSVDASYQPEMPAEAAQAQVYTTKHYKALEEGTFAGYKPLQPAQRKRLLEQARKIDQNASVQLETSAATVAPGGTITATVRTRGGIGPVIGVMLLDEPLCYQARPIQGTAWFIASAPEAIGADGKPQTAWLERRFNKQQTNLNFILVYDMVSDPAQDQYATARVSYVLKAPTTPGEYPMTAAFLYGTAEANEMQSGKYEDPPGGGSAPSGRIRFSNTVKVRVQ